MKDQLKAQLAAQLKKNLGPSLEIQQSPEGVTITDKVNLFPDIANAVKTINDDPGNHKKKALVGLAATAGGAYATHKFFTDALRKDINTRLGRPNNQSGVPAIISALLSAATPAAIYYTVQNRDRDDRFALGAVATGASLVAHNENRKRIKSTGIPPEMVAPLLKANASIMTMAGAGMYTLHQLQAAADEEKLKALETADTVSDVEKAKEINRIRSRKDFLTRYPIFRYAPYSARLRSVYNQYHQPEAKISPADADRFFIRTKIRE